MRRVRRYLQGKFIQGEIERRFRRNQYGWCCKSESGDKEVSMVNRKLITYRVDPTGQPGALSKLRVKIKCVGYMTTAPRYETQNGALALVGRWFLVHRREAQVLSKTEFEPGTVATVSASNPDEAQKGIVTNMPQMVLDYGIISLQPVNGQENRVVSGSFTIDYKKRILMRPGEDLAIHIQWLHTAKGVTWISSGFHEFTFWNYR